jgi:hypothetical protein
MYGVGIVMRMRAQRAFVRCDREDVLPGLRRGVSV